MTLTKRDIVNRISDISALSRPQAFQVVQQTLDSIAEALAQGDRVELRDFGVFEVKHRKPRVGRNPKRPETDVLIPARSIVKFKVGRELRARVLRLPVEPPRAPARRAHPTGSRKSRISPSPVSPIAASAARP